MRITTRAKRSLLSSTLALATAIGCSSPPPPPPAPAAPPVPDVEFVYWARVDAVPPANAKAGYNACGATLTVAGYRVPNHPAIEPAKIHQIDSQANVVRSWAVPVGAIPVAVDGEAILIRIDGSNELFRVATDGTIERRDLPQLARPAPDVCPPRPISQYAADVLCVEAFDISSRQKLLLEFEEVCD